MAGGSRGPGVALQTPLIRQGLTVIRPTSATTTLLYPPPPRKTTTMTSKSHWAMTGLLRSRPGMAGVGALAVVGIAAAIIGFLPQIIAAQAIPAPLPGDAGLPTPVATARVARTLPADHLSIPALSIEAPLVRVSVDGLKFPVPPDPATIGLSTSGAAVCARQGITLLAGHVSSYGTKGALWPLAAVQKGVRLFIYCPDGKLATYQAISAPEVIAKDELDPDLNTTIGRPRLVLITCGGPVLPSGHYRDNVVASFELVSTKRVIPLESPAPTPPPRLLPPKA